MKTIKQLLAEYEDYWWCPIQGNRYVLYNGQRVVGPGQLAASCPGAFNLYWLMSKLPLPTDPRFLQVCRETTVLFAQIQTIGRMEHQGIPVHEWAVTHKPKEFAEWFSHEHRRLKPAKSALVGITPHSLLQFSQALQKVLATSA